MISYIKMDLGTRSVLKGTTYCSIRFVYMATFILPCNQISGLILVPGNIPHTNTLLTTKSIDFFTHLGSNFTSMPFVKVKQIKLSQFLLIQAMYSFVKPNQSFLILLADEGFNSKRST